MPVLAKLAAPPSTATSHDSYLSLIYYIAKTINAGTLTTKANGTPSSKLKALHKDAPLARCLPPLFLTKSFAPFKLNLPNAHVYENAMASLATMTMALPLQHLPISTTPVQWSLSWTHFSTLTALQPWALHMVSSLANQRPKS